MKRLALSLIIAVGLAPWSWAQEPIMDQYRFLVGSYECVGRWPDSNRTYSGRVDISIVGDGVEMVRNIAGKKVVATGKFGTATADGIRVLRAHFKQDGAAYDETCLVSGDLDNYPRITCYVYRSETRKVGLEALFATSGR